MRFTYALLIIAGLSLSASCSRTKPVPIAKVPIPPPLKKGTTPQAKAGANPLARVPGESGNPPAKNPLAVLKKSPEPAGIKGVMPLTEGRRYVPTYAYDVIVHRDGKRETVTVSPPDAAIREAVARMTASDFVFRCPGEMRLGVSESVTFNATTPVEERLQRELELRGLPRAQAIDVSVDAVLYSDNERAFSPITSESSAGSGMVSRVWSVTPREIGQQKLNLKVTLSVTVDGVNDQRVLPLFTQAVVVNDNPARAIQTFLRDHWMWTIPPAAVLALLLVWSRHRSAGA